MSNTMTTTREGAGLLDEAIVLATQAHAGQVDKGGQPYILHPLRVMLACKTQDERIAAVLHDTVEDTPLELIAVSNIFGEHIASAVDALTRHEGETYPAFIERCAGNPIARVVKLADIADNMDVTRLGREPTPEDERRMTRYADAWNALMVRQMSAIRNIDARAKGEG